MKEISLPKSFTPGLLRLYVLLLLPVRCVLAGSLIMTMLLAPCSEAIARAASQSSNASLSGVVIDEAGAIVPDVKVAVVNNDSGLRRQATTNRDGYFVVPMLEPGVYSLSAEMPGFATVTVNDVLVTASVNSTIQIVLKPQRLNETMDILAEATVDSSASRVNPTDATKRYSIGAKQVINVPIVTSDFGRNAMAVLPFLVPGVSPTSVFGSGRSDTNRFGNQMSINGGRPTSISFYLEGADNNDEGLDQAASPLPSPDALREVAIFTNNYKADLGRSSGGILTAAIKSGGNSFDGNLRYFLVNEFFNARGFFDAQVPRDRLNTFGGQIGGPLIIPELFNGRGRTFFFVDYEQTRSGRETLSLVTVPSLRERAGNFSASSPRPFQPDERRFFPNHQIPSGLISPIAQAYLDQFIPVPNNGERGFMTLLLTEFETSQLAARVDSVLGATDNLSLSFISTTSRTIGDKSTFPVGSQSDVRGRYHNLVLTETHVFGPNRVNQLTAGVTRFIDSQVNIAPGATGVSPAEFGFTGVRPQNGLFLGVPTVNVSGTGLIVETGGGQRAARVGWQIRDDFSWSVDDHALKFGGEYRGFAQNTLRGSNNGSFSFRGSASTSNNSLSDFLMGIPFAYNQTTDNARYPRQRAYAGYGIDEWRPGADLSFNIGLRYELVPPITDKLDQVNAFRQGRRSTRFPNAPVGLLFAVDPDPVLGRVPRGLYPTDFNNFAPRLGAAYSPNPASGLLRNVFGEGKTAIRAGFGLFYDNTAGIALARVSSTQPYSVSQTLPANVIRIAGGNFANPYGGGLVNPWPLDLNKRSFLGTPALQVIDPRFRTPYVFHFNVTVQRELPGSIFFEASYLGSRGFKLARQQEINYAAVDQFATPVNIQPRRRNPFLASVMQQESSGRARYDSLQIRASRRVARGLLVDASYVYGRSMDNASEPLVGASTDQTRWGRSSYDRRQAFVGSYAYELPGVGVNGRAGSLLNGWQICGITEYRSGLPMDIAQIQDSSLTGRWQRGNPDLVAPVARYDPRQARRIVFQNVVSTGNYFFDPLAFKQVSQMGLSARPGNFGRNILDGPGLQLWSASISKQVPVTTEQKLVIRADVRNLFNHANFQMPNLLVDDFASFGKVSLAGPGRNVQLSLKYVF